MAITIKGAEEIERMRVAGRLAGSVLDMIAPYVRPGVTTEELDARCHAYIRDEIDCVPAPLNYGGTATRPPFPKSVCTSVNHQVCHGIPGKRVLKDGDIVNIDVTVIKDGYHGDTSRMFRVGKVSIQAEHVIRVAHECMMIGIEQVRPGVLLGDIGYAIQRHAEANRCSVVREYCGHGIGRRFHEDPQVLHHGRPGTGVEIVEGMTFTVEPMINAGRPETKLLKDQWTVVTKDHSLSAQWEHTVLVTPNGYEILTLGAAEREAREAASQALDASA